MSYEAVEKWPGYSSVNFRGQSVSYQQAHYGTMDDQSTEQHTVGISNSDADTTDTNDIHSDEQYKEDCQKLEELVKKIKATSDQSKLNNCFDEIFSVRFILKVIAIGYDESELSDMKNKLVFIDEKIKAFGFDKIKKELQTLEKLVESKKHTDKVRAIMYRDDGEDTDSLCDCKRKLDQLEDQLREDISKTLSQVNDATKSLSERHDKTKKEDQDKEYSCNVIIDEGIKTIYSAVKILQTIVGRPTLVDSSEMEPGINILQKSCVLIEQQINKLSKLIQGYPDKYCACPRKYAHCACPRKYAPYVLEFSSDDKDKIVNSLTHKGKISSQEIDSEKLVIFIRGDLVKSYNDYKKLVNILYANCKSHYFLVLGNNIDIEDEIRKDVEIVVGLADLDDEFLHSVCKHVMCDDEEHEVTTFSSRESDFTFVVCPSVQRLQDLIQKAVEYPYKSLTIIYSGHAKHDGSWDIPNECGDSGFTAQDLIKASKRDGASTQLEVYVYLNSCYGYKFIENVDALDTDLFWACFDVSNEYGLTHQDVKTCIDLPDDESEEYAEVNKNITKSIMKLWKRRPDIIVKKDRTMKLCFMPFSVGPLSADGVLHQMLAQNQHRSLLLSAVMRGKSKPLANYLGNHEGIDPNPSEPQIIVFKANCGDCTLFRWHNFNMLVDGGYIKSVPCFWETVRRLPQLDVVVVTHYDADHIRGILRLFEENGGSPIKIKELYTVLPLTENRKKSEKYQKHFTQNGAVELKNLTEDCTKAFVSKQLTDGDKLDIYMVTPTRQDLQDSMKYLGKRIRNTPPNIGSASLLIKCCMGIEKRYALLTGDAPAQRIVDRLDEMPKELLPPCGLKDGNTIYKFDYVDIPHHGGFATQKKDPGSTDDNPKLFLSHIHTKACVVSTNGRHRHPNKKTVEWLKESLTEQKVHKLSGGTDDNGKCFLFNLRAGNHVKYVLCNTNDLLHANMHDI